LFIIVKQSDAVILYYIVLYYTDVLVIYSSKTVRKINLRLNIITYLGTFVFGW